MGGDKRDKSADDDDIPTLETNFDAEHKSVD